MENTTSPKKGRIQLNTDEIIFDYQKIAQNTLNMVSFITTNLQDTKFDIVPNPPLFNHFKLGEIQYVGDKKIYLNMWIFNHALNDIIKAINLSLARANYFSELMKLNGKTFRIEDYEKYEKKLNRKYLKWDLPSLITGIEQKLTKPLIHLEYIKSINDVRKCLEHRTGLVTEIDTNTEIENKNVLLMKWMAQEISVIRNGERVVLDKPNVIVNKGEEVTVEIIDKTKIIGIGERIQIDLQTFNELAFTGYAFVKFIANHIDFKK